MSKPKSRTQPPPPQPVVIGARYCLRCGRLNLAVALNVANPLALGGVGAARSGCCMAETALVLVPADANANDRPLPTRLPNGIVRALAGHADGGAEVVP